jgi:hypothetical protein
VGIARFYTSGINSYQVAIKTLQHEDEFSYILLIFINSISYNILEFMTLVFLELKFIQDRGYTESSMFRI